MSKVATGSGVKVLDGEGRAQGSENARRVLALLMAFSRQRHTLRARDLAEATAIPLPSVYRYVAFLRDMGLFVGDDQGSYHLSTRFVALAQAAEAAETLIDIADPVMRRLTADTGETVILVRLVAQSAVCVHRVESTHRLRTSFEPGQALPLVRGASARLLLASMSADARRDYLAPLAERDQAAAARLVHEVALAGQRGWATSEEEIDEGVWAAAAAVRDSRGIRAALSVPSPLVRAPAAVQDQLLGRVRAAAGEINAGLTAANR
ncbi:MAG: IclR family transcriptional regulator [Nocardioidaceae bacterium]